MPFQADAFFLRHSVLHLVIFTRYQDSSIYKRKQDLFNPRHSLHLLLTPAHHWITTDRDHYFCTWSTAPSSIRIFCAWMR